MHSIVYVHFIGKYIVTTDKHNALPEKLIFYANKKNTFQNNTPYGTITVRHVCVCILKEFSAVVLYWYSTEIPASRWTSFTHNSRITNKARFLQFLPSHFSPKGLQTPPRHSALHRPAVSSMQIPSAASKPCYQCFMHEAPSSNQAFHFQHHLPPAGGSQKYHHLEIKLHCLAGWRL